jgi:K+-sensing histidine kinase KdpD
MADHGDQGPRRPRWLAWGGWLLVLALGTAVMLSARARLGQAHVALTYLLVVLGASARGGRALGLTSAVAAFVLFDVLFVPPFATLVVADPLDWLVLLAFLVTSVVGAQLLHLARAQAAAARAQADEARRADALREADRMKDALLASVSHDLRTPLTTIKALAHDIRIEGDERAAVIEAETDRLTRVVTDLLDLSRLQGGALRLDVQLTAADELLESVAQAMAGVPGAERLRMSLDPAEPLLVGRFDLVHSTRALANLVTNALAYAGGDTPVDVGAHRDGEWLAFSVADRGPGVPEPERERIFESFQRGTGTSPDARGAGLGLSIARRLAEAQHGSLVVAPRAGGGSVFTMRLPAADVEEGAGSL